MGLSSNQSQIAFRIDGWLDEWQMADGSWQMADGGWQMADGSWQLADGILEK